MKQNIPAAILVYGSSKSKKISGETRLPVIDVTRPGWIEQVEDAVYPNPIEESQIQAIGHASAVARKKIPPSAIQVISSEAEICTGLPPERKAGPSEVAARTEDIVISDRYHPAAEDEKVWINTHHLDLIKKLLGNGYKIEILDEVNNVVRTIE